MSWHSTGLSPWDLPVVLPAIATYLRTCCSVACESPANITWGPLHEPVPCSGLFWSLPAAQSSFVFRELCCLSLAEAFRLNLSTAEQPVQHRSSCQFFVTGSSSTLGAGGSQHGFEEST